MPRPYFFTIIVFFCVLQGICKSNGTINALLELHLLHADSSAQYTVGQWAQTSSPTNVAWYDIAVSNNGANIVSVANPGGIYISSNYGSSWHVTSAPDLKWRAVTSSGDGRLLTALVDDTTSVIFQSYDYGSTWIDITSSTGLLPSQEWTAIACSDSGQYLAALNTNDAIYVSNNYGATWTETTISIFWFDVAVSVSGQYMVAVAGSNSGNGGVIISRDFGENWARSEGAESDNNQWVSAAITANGQTIYAVDSLTIGGIYVTYDAGDTWSVLPNAPNATLSDIVCSDDGMFLVASYAGLYGAAWIYVSADAGHTWNQTEVSFTSFELASSASGAFVASIDYDAAVYSYTPGCAAGYEHEGYNKNGNNECVGCSEGYYSTSGVCEPCDAGTYSTTGSATSSSTCSNCVYPLWTTDNGANKCTAVYLNLPLTVQLCIFAGIFALFLAFLGNDDPKIVPVLIILIFPLLDIFTDLAYLLSSKFYDVSIFILLILCFLHPLPLFLYLLIKHRAFPTAIYYAWWLSSSTTAAEIADGRISIAEGDHVPYPTIYGHRFSLVFVCETHHNVYALAFEMLTWCVAVLFQVFWLVLLPFALVLWLVLGIFLHMTKLLAVSRIWNFWFYCWTATRDFEDVGGGIVDTKDLNHGLVVQFFLETAPQLILQATNNTLLDSWLSSPIVIFSFIMSVIMTLNVIYQYAYHSKLKTTPLSLKDIPLDKSLRLKILSIDWTIMNISLEPYSRILRCDATADPIQEKLLSSPEKAANDEESIVTSVVKHTSQAAPGRSPPHEIICPLTGRIMVHPVICEDGYTYEREALEEHLRNHGTSPITRLPLSSHSVVPNRAVLSMIQKHKEQQ